MEQAASPEPGTYRHFSGNFYRVVAVGHFVTGVGSEEQPGAEMVVYHALFSSERFGVDHYWVRPVPNFLEHVEVAGRTVPRFTPVSEDNPSTT